MLMEPFDVLEAAAEAHGVVVRRPAVVAVAVVRRRPVQGRAVERRCANHGSRKRIEREWNRKSRSENEWRRWRPSPARTWGSHLEVELGEAARSRFVRICGAALGICCASWLRSGSHPCIACRRICSVVLGSIAWAKSIIGRSGCDIKNVHSVTYLERLPSLNGRF